MQKTLASFDGTSLVYYAHGSSENTIILVHGLGGSSKGWADIIPMLTARGYRVICLDNRGHGFSDRPSTIESYTVEHFARDIKVLIDHENITAPFLVGHCFGAAILMKFAQLYPDIANGYAFMGGTPASDKRLARILWSITPFTFISNRVMRYYEVTGPFSYANPKKLIGLPDIHYKRIWKAIKHTSLKSWLYGYQQYAHFDAIAQLGQIRQKCLVVYGKDDVIYPKEYSLQTFTHLRNAELEEVPGGHNFIIAYPAASAHVLLSFAQKLDWKQKLDLTTADLAADQTT